MSNSIRRNTAFDLTKPEFQKPQNRLEANRWLLKATFGAGTPETDLELTTTKTNIVPRSDCQDDAAVLMDIGYEAYVNQQFQEEIQSLRQVCAERRAYENQQLGTDLGYLHPYGFSGDPNYNAVFKWWWGEVIHGKAQIRHKLAYALSQIFVVDENEGGGRGTPDSEAYYDILVRATEDNNTSTYLQLLEEVTYSPMMSRMLTYSGNKKFDPVTGARPDENYAREILQLFSIGLKQLNMDGTPMLDENGVEMETYTSEDITNLASVFTGFEAGYASPNPPYKMYLGQRYWENLHETGEKILFAYPNQDPVIIPDLGESEFKAIDYKPQREGFVVLNATENEFQVAREVSSAESRNNQKIWYSTSSDLSNRVTAYMDFTPDFATIKKANHGLSNGDIIYSYSTLQESIDICLNHIFNHPTLPPFIAKSLIKFFVTSNPSPQYVRRVAEKFVDNGNGVRGDLASVTKAILLDREAIVPYGINPVVYGRSTTIVDRLVRVARAFKDDLIHAAVELKRYGSTTAVRDPYWDRWPFDKMPRIFTKPEYTYQYGACSIPITRSLQVLRSPSVFNFYRPGYVPPGSPIGEVGKTAPELQMNTVGEQIDWMWQVAAFAETEKEFFRVHYGNPDPVGHDLQAYGLEFETDENAILTIKDVSSTSAFTVDMDRTTTVVDDRRISKPYTTLKRLSDGTYAYSGYVKSPNPNPNEDNVEYFSGAKGSADFAVGDQLIGEPLWILPPSGLGHRNTKEGRALNFMLYKFENLLPETPGESSDADLNAVIDHVEEKLMTRPISQSLRQKMREIGKLPTVAQLSAFSPDYDNHYRNFVMTHSQKKIRRMIGLLLVSPEFFLQD